MIQPAPLPLTGNRWTPFVQDIAVTGVDLTGATFRAQLRLQPGTPGDPLVDLQNATAGSEGVSVQVATVDSTTTSTITLRINETTMEGLPEPDSPADDLALWWDIQVTRSGYSKAVWFRGPFTVLPGVTQ